MADKPKKTPSERLEDLEFWAGRATIAIIVGLALELLVPFGLIERASNWDHVLVVIANLLIIGGLIIEYVCIRRTIIATRDQERESNEEIAKLNKLASEADARAEEARQRANELQLQLAKFRTPRAALLEGVSFADSLRQFAGTYFDTGHSGGDGEQADFIWKLVPLLQAAGWLHAPWSVTGVGQSVIRQAHLISGQVAAADVEIHVHPETEDSLGPRAQALADALSAFGIPARRRLPFNAQNANANAIHILVGQKA